MVNPFQRMQQAIRVGCPFCFEWIPKLKTVTAVYSPEGAKGGRCECGAVFVLDETGRSGGLALLDAQTLLCDGDSEAACKLETGVHVDVQTRPLHGMGQSQRGPQVGRLIWFVKRRDDAPEER